MDTGMDTHMDTFGHSWTLMDTCGHSWTLVDTLGHLSSLLDSCGHFWRLAESGQVSSPPPYARVRDFYNPVKYFRPLVLITTVVL